MKKQTGTTLNCFSPPIMLATLIIEFSLAAYTILRYKLTTVTRLIAATLVSLAVFQVAEYHVCTASPQGELWSRIGFVAITALPALGTHLVSALSGNPRPKIVALAYASMASFMLYFSIRGSAFSGHQCTGNYVMFQIGDTGAAAYGTYYYGWLVYGIVQGSAWVKNLREAGTDMLVKAQTTKALIIGYLVFLVPTGIANTVKPETRRGIPSVMCGFAVIFALILALYVLPKVATRRSAARPQAS